jgi:hypothetical protein
MIKLYSVYDMNHVLKGYELMITKGKKTDNYYIRYNGHYSPLLHGLMDHIKGDRKELFNSTNNDSVTNRLIEALEQGNINGIYRTIKSLHSKKKLLQNPELTV